MVSRFLSILLLVCTIHSFNLFAKGGSYGYLEPYKIFKLSPPSMGIISSIDVKEGDRVSKNQILAKIDARILEEDLGISKVQLNHQQKLFNKFSELWETGNLAPEEFDQAKLELEFAKHKVRRIEQEIESRILRSPDNGLILEIKHNLFESVTPSNQHVMTVVRIDELTLQLHVPSGRAKDIEQGDAITLHVHEMDKDIEGVVEFKSPLIDAVSNTVRMKLRISNKDFLISSGLKASLLL